MIGRLLGLSRPEAKTRAAELLERFELDRRGRAARQDVLRRHAPPPRPGREPGRPAARALPRRADHRPRPAQPQRGLGHGPRLVADGTTVLLTTQYLEEADQLAHDIAVIDHGSVIATGTPDELKAQRRAAGPRSDPRQPGRPERGRGSARTADRRDASHQPSSRARSASKSSTAARCRDIVRAFEDRSIELAEFALRRASLDEVFLTLTGHRAEEETPAKQESAAAGKAGAAGAAGPRFARELDRSTR